MNWFSDFLSWFKPQAIKETIVKPKTVIINDLFVGGIPQCGIDLIKKLEGCKLQAYLDQKGIATIGVGHTEGVRLGDTCTQAQADEWLAFDCAWAWQAIRSRVQVPLTSNQSGALLSFVFSLGAPQFEKSTLLANLNAGNYQSVPNEIKQWVWITMPDGTRKISLGLANRRKAEAALFIGADWRQV